MDFSVERLVTVVPKLICTQVEELSPTLLRRIVVRLLVIKD
jgi:hypothetical protein